MSIHALHMAHNKSVTNDKKKQNCNDSQIWQVNGNEQCRSKIKSIKFVDYENE